VTVLANNFSWGRGGRQAGATAAPPPPPTPSHPAMAPGPMQFNPDYAWANTPHRRRLAAHVADEGTDTDASPPPAVMAITYPQSGRRSPVKRDMMMSPSKRGGSPRKFY
jgi:hypothetical protein